MTLPKDNPHDPSVERDPLWELLSRDARTHPVVPSPWFSTRVAAKALATPQVGERTLVQRSFQLLRWLVPIPIACSALLALMAWNHSRLSEEKFERHMDFLASSGYDFGVQ